ncbi:hypothetical protein PHYPSEUDO_007018 [Phytophthora pseudosyringae]|uniref:Uncharacterized protein n=1 Tax=Phytophthora pseudosyringae TaxID=221518 RepID=A0A8T1VK70_9STRA|nr:hypothetical protein PHYPSEUDO_007018 [Phytophthora pseudosyringae]
MSSELPFPEPEDAQNLLQDVLAFLDDNPFPDATSTLPVPSRISKDRVKTARQRVYSPDYERCRREKKKAERETLLKQVAQYEEQLELLRLSKPTPCQESKWGWVHAATAEDEKRDKAEELNRQLRGILALQLNSIQILHGCVSQEALFAQRVQAVMAKPSPCTTPMPTVTFTSLGAIAAHVKRMFGRLRASADYVFSSDSLAMEDPKSIGRLMSSANVKHEDPLAGPCIELLSSTPLTCSFRTAVPLLWSMLLDKKVLGPLTGRYTVKTKQLTERSAEFGYSANYDAFGAFEGVTLFEKHQGESWAIMLWGSMVVDLDGNPFSVSQGFLSVSRLSSNPEQESIVRSSSRLSGKHFGVSDDRAHMDTPVARKNMRASKTILERAQLRLMECAEHQNV